jgi:hypothetical protein
VPPTGGIGSQAGKITAQVPAPRVPLKIISGTKSAEGTPDYLAALPHKTITVFNEHAKVNQTYTGVLLIDLLTPLGVAAKPHGKDFALYLVAEGETAIRLPTPWPRPTWICRTLR